MEMHKPDETLPVGCIGHGHLSASRHVLPACAIQWAKFCRAGISQGRKTDAPG